MSTDRAPHPTPRPVGASMPRVAVCSVHALVADSVATALAGRDFVVRRLSFESVGGGFDVGILIDDLRPAALADVRAVIKRSGKPWVVLTDAPRGPQWGAVLGAGAVEVLSASSSLKTVGSRLVVAARSGRAYDAEEAALVVAYEALQDAEAEVAMRMGTLSARERQVLERLHRGKSVREIAEHLELAEETVRSQVKTLLRKLGVNSQIAAVALYDSFRVSGRADHGAQFDVRRPRGNPVSRRSAQAHPAGGDVLPLATVPFEIDASSRVARRPCQSE